MDRSRLSAIIAVTAFGFPSRSPKDPFSDVIHLPVPLPVNRRIEVKNDDLSLVSIWNIHTHLSSAFGFGVEPSFEFRGQPGEFGPLNVSLLGYDRAGELIYRETQQAMDGRLVKTDEATLRMGWDRSRLSSPNFRIPQATLDQLARLDLVFEQDMPGRAYRPAPRPSQMGEE